MGVWPPGRHPGFLLTGSRPVPMAATTPKARAGALMVGRIAKVQLATVSSGGLEAGKTNPGDFSTSCRSTARVKMQNRQGIVPQAKLQLLRAVDLSANFEHQMNGPTHRPTFAALSALAEPIARAAIPAGDGATLQERLGGPHVASETFLFVGRRKTLLLVFAARDEVEAEAATGRDR
ncbi:hypothetical protein B0T16DRAFT_393113 [Cercophora newfieldiana]|uniref:Uncharacterized protein n=1 Tax=Cercophora newfieldiana TaxID=92897 RepID=A0AA39XUW5_9PEZI|nr:hypothetical protein B0T16DRAFT_393113 [Cercophora newfieldiana]